MVLPKPYFPLHLAKPLCYIFPRSKRLGAAVVYLVFQRRAGNQGL